MEAAALFAPERTFADILRFGAALLRAQVFVEDAPERVIALANRVERASIRPDDLSSVLDDYRDAHAAAASDAIRAAMLTRQAKVLRRLGRGSEADHALNAAEGIPDRIGFAGRGRAEIHEQRGNRAFVSGDYAECLRQHAAELSFAEAVGDPRGIACAHIGLGDAHFAASRFCLAYKISTAR